MELYYTSGASLLAAHIVARELGLAGSLNKVDPVTSTTGGSREFASIHLKGYVPTSEIKSGAVLTEVTSLLLYLADQASKKRLAPANSTLERYRFIEWLIFISSEIHKGFGPPWTLATSEATRRAAIERLEQRFTYLDWLLTDRPCLMGEGFTAADAYLFTIVNWATYHNVALSPCPNLLAFLARVYARLAVPQASQAQGLLEQAA